MNKAIIKQWYKPQFWLIYLPMWLMQLRLKRLVNRHGGFINLCNSECDTIWGYWYSPDDEMTVEEMKIHAIQIIDGYLCILMAPSNITYTPQQMIEDPLDEYIGLNSVNSLSWFNTLHLTEYIDEYL